MRHIPNSRWMKLALCSAQWGIKRSAGGPFGAVIVYKGRALSVAHNTVLKKNDPTCHAEINAIREASRKLKTFDLRHCVIYSTTEPCPMCFAAIHWARIPLVVYGTGIRDVARRGFNELFISNQRMKQIGKSKVRVKPDFMKEECLRLLEDWDQKAGKKTY